MPTGKMKSPFEVLGLSKELVKDLRYNEDALVAVAKAMGRGLAKAFHPDLNPLNSEIMTKRMQDINEAVSFIERNKGTVELKVRLEEYCKAAQDKSIEDTTIKRYTLNVMPVQLRNIMVSLDDERAVTVDSRGIFIISQDGRSRVETKFIIGSIPPEKFNPSVNLTERTGGEPLKLIGSGTAKRAFPFKVPQSSCAEIYRTIEGALRTKSYLVSGEVTGEKHLNLFIEGIIAAHNSRSDEFIKIGILAEKANDVNLAIEAYAEADAKERLIAIGDAMKEKKRFDIALRAYFLAEAFDRLAELMKENKSRPDLVSLFSAYLNGDKKAIVRIAEASVKKKDERFALTALSFTGNQRAYIDHLIKNDRLSEALKLITNPNDSLDQLEKIGERALRLAASKKEHYETAFEAFTLLGSEDLLRNLANTAQSRGHLPEAANAFVTLKDAAAYSKILFSLHDYENIFEIAKGTKDEKILRRVFKPLLAKGDFSRAREIAEMLGDHRMMKLIVNKIAGHANHAINDLAGWRKTAATQTATAQKSSKQNSQNDAASTASRLESLLRIHNRMFRNVPELIELTNSAKAALAGLKGKRGNAPADASEDSVSDPAEMAAEITSRLGDAMTKAVMVELMAEREMLKAVPNFGDSVRLSKLFIKLGDVETAFSVAMDLDKKIQEDCKPLLSEAIQSHDDRMVDAIFEHFMQSVSIEEKWGERWRMRTPLASSEIIDMALAYKNYYVALRIADLMRRDLKSTRETYVEIARSMASNGDFADAENLAEENLAYSDHIYEALGEVAEEKKDPHTARDYYMKMTNGEKRKTLLCVLSNKVFPKPPDGPMDEGIRKSRIRRIELGKVTTLKKEIAPLEAKRRVVEGLLREIRGEAEKDVSRYGKILLTLYSIVDLNENRERYLRLSRALAATGNDRGAIEAFKRSKGTDPDAVVIGSMKRQADSLAGNQDSSAAQLYTKIKDYASLIKLAEEKAIDPSSVESHYSNIEYTIAKFDILPIAYQNTLSWMSFVLKNCKDEAMLSEARSLVERIAGFADQIHAELRDYQGKSIYYGKTMGSVITTIARANALLNRKALISKLTSIFETATNEKEIDIIVETLNDSALRKDEHMEPNVRRALIRCSEILVEKGRFNDAIEFARRSKDKEAELRCGDKAVEVGKLDIALRFYRYARADKGRMLRLFDAALEQESRLVLTGLVEKLGSTATPEERAKMISGLSKNPEFSDLKKRLSENAPE